MIPPTSRFYYNPSALNHYESPFRKKPLTEEEAHAKMLRNTQKAFEEHVRSEVVSQNGSSVYALSAPFPQPGPHTYSSPLRAYVSSASSIGSRQKMEDVPLYFPTSSGFVMGVFDGHSGDLVAKFASSRFSELFPTVLEKTNGHTHKALEVTTGLVQKETSQKLSPKYMGSTAAIAVVDQKKHQVTTMTLGDSEVNIYREKEDEIFSCPLSPIRNWTSPRDIARAQKNSLFHLLAWSYTPTNQMANTWNFIPKSSKDRYIRSADFNNSTNVARAFGKDNYANTNTHKPKIATATLQEGDLLVAASDGLKDHREDKIVNTIYKAPPQELARALVNYGASHKLSDNVGVVVAQVK